MFKIFENRNPTTCTDLVSLQKACTSYDQIDLDATVLSVRMTFSVVDESGRYRVRCIDTTSLDVFEQYAASQTKSVNFIDVYVIRALAGTPDAGWTMNRLINLSVIAMPDGHCDWVFTYKSGKTFHYARDIQDAGTPRLIYQLESYPLNRA